MDKPRVIGVKDFVLEERAPPSENDFHFIEKWEPAGERRVREEQEPEKRPADLPKPSVATKPITLQPSFFDKLKSIFGF